MEFGDWEKYIYLSSAVDDGRDVKSLAGGRSHSVKASEFESESHPPNGSVGSDCLLNHGVFFS